ncbi:MAG: tRNA glutamyl-Q(34) synthetase GluQRS [Gammaproteobacteria bacterium HGW-Gammaproteobacteria-8]|nr:MAG: tRNA glutamyl-Q(34) synthetase GluQRS [Gammaproteobacteria bacterium HGW-Gammaproteobacteria-8]
MSSVYRGRFAPSPTGPLHFGSMLAAVGSYLQAKSRKGRWLVRIEDIDPPREVPGAAQHQLETLARFGLQPDEAPLYQSASAAQHRAALTRLLETGAAFRCGCSRRDLPASGVYPGTCRDGLPPGRRARSIRFRINDQPEHFVDRIHGAQCVDLARECGDFVIRRADGLIAYQLAVVVDDIASGITEVVRGADLLDSSARQQALYRALGAAPPQWVHLPLVVDRSGAKLSKSDNSDPVAAGSPATTLRQLLSALGHPPPPEAGSLDRLWRWAIENWNLARVPREPIKVPQR